MTWMRLLVCGLQIGLLFFDVVFGKQRYFIFSGIVFKANLFQSLHILCYFVFYLFPFILLAVTWKTSVGFSNCLDLNED